MVGWVGLDVFGKLSTLTRPDPKLKIKFQPNPTHQFKKTNPKHEVGLNNMNWIGGFDTCP